jgi:hypothetical protein
VGTEIVAAIVAAWAVSRPKGEEHTMPVEQLLVETAAKLGLEAVKKFFEGKKDDKDLISVGLAVGYFYNFLDLISDVIRRDEVTLRDKPDDKDGRHFDADTVELQVILPARLDVAAYDRCERDFKATKKSLIFLPQQNRWYGINYNLVERGDKPGIVIMDLARPLMAVKRFYEEILAYPTHDEANEKWIKAQRSEIAAFKETLLRLQKRGYGALVNRLDFRERA